MSKQNESTDSNNKSFSSMLENVTSIGQIYVNIETDYFVVTDDKVTQWLNEHWKYVEKKHRWIVPLSIMIPVVIALATCSFQRKLFGIPDAVWEAIFYIVAGVTFLWFICDFISFIKMKYYDKVLSVDEMVSKLKKDSMLLKDFDSNFSKSHTQEEEELSIAKECIQIYLKEKLKRMSFDRVREDIDESYTDEFLIKLLKKYPKVFRRCPMKPNRKPGITLTREASQST